MAIAGGVLTMFFMAGWQAPADTVWKPVVDAIGRAGQQQPDCSYTVGWPRPDLRVSIAGIPMKPILGLSSSATFSGPGEDAMVMGDLLLTDDEAHPVIAALVAGGVEITAVHNHMTREIPRLVYVHVAAHGAAPAVARTLKAALALTGMGGSAAAAPPSAAHAVLDTALLERTLGFAGRAAGGGFQFRIPRRETVNERGMRIPASMGLSSVMNFQATEDGRVAMTGDFVLLGSEVQPVIRALAGSGIEVTALHSHMLAEEPRLFFLHLWGHDRPERITQGLKAAVSVLPR